MGGLAAAWAAAVVAGEIRAALATSVGIVATSVRRRSVRGVGMWRPFLTLVLGLVVAVAVPILGDMFNYSPDADMRIGGPPAIGLFGGGVAGSPEPSAGVGATGPGGVAGSTIPDTGLGGGASTTESPAPTPDSSGLLPSISGGAGATSSARPWLATLPTGSGRIVPKIHLPPPWTNGADWSP